MFTSGLLRYVLVSRFSFSEVWRTDGKEKDETYSRHATFAEIAQLWSLSVMAPERTVRTVQQIAVLFVVSFWGSPLRPGTVYMTPKPMRRHRPIFVRLLICRLRRKMTGRAAQTRSVIIDRTAFGQHCRFRSEHGSIPPCAMTMSLTWESLRHPPSTPTSQYAFNGLQIPRKKNTETAVKRIVNPINAYIHFFTRLESTMRSRNRQIEIFVNANVMKVCIQSAHPIARKRRLWDAVR